MYVNPFLAGIVFTLLIEMLILVVATIYIGSRRNKK